MATTSSRRSHRTTSGQLDLHIELDGGSGLRTGLENALRNAIRSGRLPRGSRLPSTRSLARDLGFSRGTVVAAYEQLAVEGWLQSAHGSGSVVIADPSPVRQRARTSEGPTWRFDLRPTRPDPSSFPRAEWLRALRRALAAAPDEFFSYGDPQGALQLRDELARYLGRARGLQLTPENLIVTSGFTQALNLVARAVPPGTVAMEEPSWPAHREIVRGLGHEVTLLPVDREGANVDKLLAADLVLLTPNRQHLLGTTLSAARRTRLLDWARASDSIVVENDYDGEFRYDMRPLVPLQALEPSHVIYAGTTSKSLAPALRIGWLAVPDGLVDRIAHLKHNTDAQNSIFDQLAFAEFLRSGGYDSHVRRQRLRYRRRRDALLAALPPTLATSGEPAGLNLVVHLPDAAAEESALDAAQAHGVKLSGLIDDGYYEGEPQAGLIVGYGAAPEHSFAQALSALTDALRSCGFYGRSRSKRG